MANRFRTRTFAYSDPAAEIAGYFELSRKFEMFRDGLQSSRNHARQIVIVPGQLATEATALGGEEPDAAIAGRGGPRRAPPGEDADDWDREPALESGSAAAVAELQAATTSFTPLRSR